MCLSGQISRGTTGRRRSKETKGPDLEESRNLRDNPGRDNEWAQLSPPSQKKEWTAEKRSSGRGPLGEQALMADSTVWCQQLLWLSNCQKCRDNDDSHTSLPSEGLGLEHCRGQGEIFEEPKMSYLRCPWKQHLNRDQKNIPVIQRQSTYLTAPDVDLRLQACSLWVGKIRVSPDKNSESIQWGRNRGWDISSNQTLVSVFCWLPVAPTWELSGNLKELTAGLWKWPNSVSKGIYHQTWAWPPVHIRREVMCMCVHMYTDTHMWVWIHSHAHTQFFSNLQ